MHESFGLLRFRPCSRRWMDVRASTTEEVVQHFAKLFDLPTNNPSVMTAALMTMESEIKNLQVQKDLEIKNAKLEINNVKLEMKNENLAMKNQNLMELNTKDLELKEMAVKISYFEKTLLESKQTATARGIFEFFLKECKIELGKTGAFNAKEVCIAIQSTAANDPQKLGPKSRILWNCATATNATLYEVYGELSDNIHGQPWSGPSLRVASKNMSKVTFELIRSLAKQLHFVIDEV